MVGIFAIFLPSIPPVSRSLPIFFNNSQIFPSVLTKTLTQNPRKLRRFVVFVENDNGQNKEQKEKQNGYNNGQEDLKRDVKSVFNFRLRDLLNPDRDNILAIGLTGLLTWASVQVLGQLFFITIAILVAALKYSFIAALLLFILITLL